MRGISRKVLAEASDMSECYVEQIKAVRTISANREPMVFATVDGIVSEPLTFELLRCSPLAQSSPEGQMARGRQQGDLRSMANERAAMDETRAILSNREPLHGRAGAIVDPSGRSVDVTVNDVLSEVASGRAAVSKAA